MPRSDQTLREYLGVSDVSQASARDINNVPLGQWFATEENRLAAQLCLVLCKKATRKVFAGAARPDEDQLLAMACSLIDQGWPIEDEHVILIAQALAKSKLTLKEIARVAA